MNSQLLLTAGLAVHRRSMHHQRDIGRGLDQLCYPCEKQKAWFRKVNHPHDGAEKELVHRDKV
jgi:hypothetical protein